MISAPRLLPLYALRLRNMIFPRASPTLIAGVKMAALSPMDSIVSPTAAGHRARSVAFSLSLSSRSSTMANSVGCSSSLSHRMWRASLNDTFVLMRLWYMCNSPSFTAGRRSKARTPQSHSSASVSSWVLPRPGVIINPSPVAASCAPGMESDATVRVSSMPAIHRRPSISCAISISGAVNVNSMSISRVFMNGHSFARWYQCQRVSFENE